MIWIYQAQDSITVFTARKSDLIITLDFPKSARAKNRSEDHGYKNFVFPNHENKQARYNNPFLHLIEFLEQLQNTGPLYMC